MKCSVLHFFNALTAITAFITKIQRNHRIFFYKNAPKNLDPGSQGQAAEVDENKYRQLIKEFADRTHQLSVKRMSDKFKTQSFFPQTD